MEYSLCAGIDDSFTINNVDAVGSAAVDNGCVEDYLGIEGKNTTLIMVFAQVAAVMRLCAPPPHAGSSLVCTEGPLSSAFFVSRLCGRTFSPVAGAVVDTNICGEGSNIP